MRRAFLLTVLSSLVVSALNSTAQGQEASEFWRQLQDRRPIVLSPTNPSDIAASPTFSCNPARDSVARILCDGRAGAEADWDGVSFCGNASASQFGLQIQLEKTLSPKFVQAAQDAATNWTKGTTEKLLAAPVIPIVAEPRPGDRPNEPPKTQPIVLPSGPEFSPKSNAPRAGVGPTIRTAVWTPLSKDFHRPPMRINLSAEDLYAKTHSSVWIVFAASTASPSESSTVSQGSAVAISRSHLLTNYHVIDGQPFVFIKQGDTVLEATVIAGDKESDRCVLAVKGEPLRPVEGLRDSRELRIGEQVYTIGSPSLLESTLGQGIVSGLRAMAGRKLVQTTAPISPGSSGGGLFDNAGNLVGITSFRLKDSQGLNFAIATDDYFR